jgi:hypothetical protein
MNLSIIVASKNYNSIDSLIERINLKPLLFSGCELIFIFFDKDYVVSTLEETGLIQVLTNNCDGIYASYNSGIKIVKTDYYLIFGDDDKFCGDALFLRSILIGNSFDLFVFDVVKNNRIIKGYFPAKIFSSVLGVFPSHSGGMIIKKSLHSEFGFYENIFKYLADQFFLIQCILNNKRIKYVPYIISNIGSEGFSSNYYKALIDLRIIILNLNLGLFPFLYSFYLQYKRFLSDLWRK